MEKPPKKTVNKKEKTTKKVVNKKEKPKKVVNKKPKKKIVNSGFTIEKDIEDVSESGKYSEKLSSLINKIKMQNENNSNVRIRFGWK